jgi:acyl carrier protein
MHTVEAIRRFMVTELRLKEAETIGSEVSLVRSGVLDSIELMQVVEFMEKEFGITVDDTEILPENLGSLSAMASFVERKSAAKR